MVASGIVYYANWNGTNYTTFITTNETTKAWNGVAITADGNRIAFTSGGYGAGVSTLNVYWSNWTGTNYSSGIVVSGAVGSATHVRFSPDGNIIYMVTINKATGTLMYSLWNGSSYSNFTYVGTSVIPANLNTYSLAIGLNKSIYVGYYSASTTTNIYKTTINISNYSII